MPKKRRQGKIPTPAWEHPRGAIGSRLLGRGFQFYGAVVVGALIVLALGVIGYAFWADYQEEQGRPGSTAIQVEDARYRLDYFSRRLKMFVDQNGGQGVVQPTSALPAVSDLIIGEEIVRRFASEEDVTASEEEVNEEIASRLGVAADDESFDLVFEQELARSGISEEDYLEMIEAAVLRDKLLEQFLMDVPDTAESARYRQILVSTDELAREIRAEIEDGGDFVELAAENSLDTATRDSGGEVGWVPRGVLEASTEELIFTLEPGALTTIPTNNGVLVIEMEEKDDNHPVEEDQKQALAEAALDDWVSEKRQSLAIVNNMDVGGSGDREKIAWAVERAYQS